MQPKTLQSLSISLILFPCIVALAQTQFMQLNFYQYSGLKFLDYFMITFAHMVSKYSINILNECASFSFINQ